MTLTRNGDNAVLNKDIATALGKIKISGIEWYVPHYTASMSQQTILSNQIVNKISTEPQYIQRSVFMKEANTQNLWNFELGTQEGNNIPVWIIIGFQQSTRQNSQNENNDTFYRPPVTSAQCNIGTENYPDSGILLNYDDDDYNQGYGQIKEAFTALTKMIYSNHIYQNVILDRQIIIMILIIIYTFSIYDIRKSFKIHNRYK